MLPMWGANHLASTSRDPIRCFLCGKLGHKKAACASRFKSPAAKPKSLKDLLFDFCIQYLELQAQIKALVSPEMSAPLLNKMDHLYSSFDCYAIASSKLQLSRDGRYHQHSVRTSDEGLSTPREIAHEGVNPLDAMSLDPAVLSCQRSSPSSPMAVNLIEGSSTTLNPSFEARVHANSICEPASKHLAKPRNLRRFEIHTHNRFETLDIHNLEPDNEGVVRFEIHTHNRFEALDIHNLEPDNEGVVGAKSARLSRAADGVCMDSRGRASRLVVGKRVSREDGGLVNSASCLAWTKLEADSSLMNQVRMKGENLLVDIRSGCGELLCKGSHNSDLAFSFRLNQFWLAHNSTLGRPWLSLAHLEKLLTVLKRRQQYISSEARDAMEKAVEFSNVAIAVDINMVSKGKSDIEDGVSGKVGTVYDGAQDGSNVHAAHDGACYPYVHAAHDVHATHSSSDDIHAVQNEAHDGEASFANEGTCVGASYSAHVDSYDRVVRSEMKDASLAWMGVVTGLVFGVNVTGTECDVAHIGAGIIEEDGACEAVSGCNGADVIDEAGHASHVDTFEADVYAVNGGHFQLTMLCQLIRKVHPWFCLKQGQCLLKVRALVSLYLTILVLVLQMLPHL